MIIRRLFFASCIIALLSCFAFADSDDESAKVFPHIQNEVSVSNESFQLVIPDEYYDSVYLKLATGDVRATSYDTTDIYNLLDSALRGENYMSVYSLPKVTSYVNRIAQTLYGSGQSVPTTSLYSIASSVLSRLSYNLEGSTVGVGNLLGEIMYDTVDIKNYNANISSKLTSIDSKLSSYNWSNLNWSYSSARESLNGSTVGSGNYDHLFFVGIIPQSVSVPAVLRLYVPWTPSLEYVSIPDLDISSVHIYTDQMYSTFKPSDIFTEFTNGGFYLYLFNFNISSPNGIYIFEIETPSVFTYDSSVPLTLYSIPFDSDDYQQMKQAFYLQKATKSLGSLDKLADVYASSDKINAMSAQLPVEQQVLSDFSGQGTESLSLSDVGAVKNASGALKTMLRAGGDIGAVLRVLMFHDLYGFFSNEVAEETETWFNGTTTRGSSEFISDSDYYLNLNNYLDSLSYDAR